MRRIIVIPFLLICLLLTCGCAADQEKTLVVRGGGFNDALARLLPDFEIIQSIRPSIDALNDGIIIEAYDAQALAALESGAAQHWLPLCLETVVIAVDRTKTQTEIVSWEDLLKIDETVGLRDTFPEARLTVAAFCYGLEGEAFTLKTASKYMESLYRSGKLKFNDEDAAVQLCFDSEAAARRKNGENIEIIIPAQGTLTFTRGLLSRQPIELQEDAGKVLLDNALRLTDGTSEEGLFPPEEAYGPSAAMNDYTYLNGVMQDLTRTLRREVLHVRLYTSANLREHQLFALIFICATILAIGSMRRRALQTSVRRAISAAGALLVSWALVRILKYQIIDETTLGRYAWYLFYFFEACLPLVMLKIAVLTSGENNPAYARIFRLQCGLNAVLFGFVITNDLHNWVFRLDLSQAGWSRHYEYGLIFWIVIFVFLSELVQAVLMLFAGAKTSPRRYGFVFPLIFIAPLVTYAIGYAVRVPLFVESDMTIVTGAFSLLFIELCIRTGQIPVNIRYGALFANAAIKLQITDGGGSRILGSPEPPPQPFLWDKLKKSDDPVQPDENTLLYAKPVAGGYAVWRDDITALNALKRELEISNKQLAAANALLSAEERIKGEAAEAKARLELYCALERDFSARRKQLAERLTQIPRDEAEQNLHRALLAVDVCYIKRRSNLFFLEMSGLTEVSLDEFAVYMDELSEIARLSGTHCFTFCDLRGKLSLRRAALFYDLFDSVLQWVIGNRCSRVLQQTVYENSRIVMKLLLPREALLFRAQENLKKEVRLAGGIIETKDLGDTAGVWMSFPQEEGCHA